VEEGVPPPLLPLEALALEVEVPRTELLERGEREKEAEGVSVADKQPLTVALALFGEALEYRVGRGEGQALPLGLSVGTGESEKDPLGVRETLGMEEGKALRECEAVTEVVEDG
jgi:hypothetical protein